MVKPNSEDGKAIISNFYSGLQIHIHTYMNNTQIANQRHRQILSFESWLLNLHSSNLRAIDNPNPHIFS
jgi:hypothetical protein